MTRKRIVVLGAGGMARETVALIRALNRSANTFDFIGYVVTDTTRIGPHDSASAIVGDYEWLSDHRDTIDAIAMGIGSPFARLRVAEEVKKIVPNAEWPILIHPSAEFDCETAKLSDGSFIGAGVVATVNL